MPTLEAITNAYDYFTPVEDAIAAVFTAAGVKCFTPLGRQPDDGVADGKQLMQKDRPRVEVVVHPGSNMGRLHGKTGVKAAAGNLRETMRRCGVVVTLVTEANIAQHRAFACQVLCILDTIAIANNTRSLENHCIQGFRVGGGTFGDKSDGVMRTDLECEADISTQLYAIEALET